MLAYIVPIEGGHPDQGLPEGGGGGHPDQGLPGVHPGLPPGWWTKPPRPTPWPPIALPPLPGIYPPAGQVTLPIVLPPQLWPPHPLPEPPGGIVMPPIYIDGSPTNPINLPPGIYPPLPPHEGSGKYAILIWILGVGFRWLVVDPGAHPGQPLPSPPEGTPKK